MKVLFFDKLIIFIDIGLIIVWNEFILFKRVILFVNLILLL